jgi:hypothetical protein
MRVVGKATLSFLMCVVCIGCRGEWCTGLESNEVSGVHAGIFWGFTSFRY